MPRIYPSILSRKPLVIWLVVCLAVSAAAIPFAAHLPRWVEIELVFGAWWAIWVCALTWLLFHGHEVDDDAEVDRPELVKRMGGDGHGGCLDSAGCLDPNGCMVVDEGCGQGLLVVVALILGGLAVLLIVEFLIPAVAMLLLASIGGMVARAVNDRHECQGRLGLSLFWGALWATVYVGPVAALAIWGTALVQQVQ